ncbi:MAG: hypothetical protein AAF581_10335 [Planctomycetota bacterium]
MTVGAIVLLVPFYLNVAGCDPRRVSLSWYLTLLGHSFENALCLEVELIFLVCLGVFAAEVGQTLATRPRLSTRRQLTIIAMAAAFSLVAGGIGDTLRRLPGVTWDVAFHCVYSFLVILSYLSLFVGLRLRRQ